VALDSLKIAAALLIAIVPTASGQDAGQPESRAASAPAVQEAESRPAARPESAPAGGTIEAVCEARSAPYEVSGFWSTSYRVRTGDPGNDQDLYSYVSLDGGNRDVDDVLFHLLGRVTYDFDGSSADDPFFSLNDVNAGTIDAHVYEAFVDLQRGLAPDSLGVRRVRIGRQNVYAAFTYLVDGLRLDFEPIESAGNLELAVFGGLPEYLYEDSRSGNWIAGMEASFKPWCDGRIDLRYTHIQDESEWVEGGSDDYASIALRQRLTDDLSFYGIWNTIDAGTRDVSFRVDWSEPRCDLSLHGLYRYQSTITSEYTTVYDPYVAVLGTSFAYHQVQLEASKIFCDVFGVDAGVAGRILSDSDDESTFNHEFVRAWLTLSASRWIAEDVDVALTGEFWHASDEDTASAGGEITWRPSDKLKVSAGSYYSLYKQDLFVIEENVDVTTIFLRVAWKFAEDFRFDGRYEYETGDEGVFHTAMFGLTWTF
jgi:hypothetical protein